MYNKYLRDSLGRDVYIFIFINSSLGIYCHKLAIFRNLLYPYNMFILGLEQRLENNLRSFIARTREGSKVLTCFYQCCSYLDWPPKLDYCFIMSTIVLFLSVFISRLGITELRNKTKAASNIASTYIYMYLEHTHIINHIHVHVFKF